jgi:hypothetical protein
VLCYPYYPIRYHLPLRIVMGSKKIAGEYKHAHDAPSATDASNASLRHGYNQTYVILKNNQPPPGREAKGEEAGVNLTNPGPNDVFFRCGNWCYRGEVDFMGLDLGLHGVPALIPCLQRQQGSLRYFCTVQAIPESSAFFDPVEYFYSANDFVANEVTSEKVSGEMKKWSSVFPWIDDDSSATYFELMTEPPECMKKVLLLLLRYYYYTTTTTTTTTILLLRYYITTTTTTSTTTTSTATTIMTRIYEISLRLLLSSAPVLNLLTSDFL